MRGLVHDAKRVQSKWDVDNLHRHPDYAPVKKEPVQERRISEDNALPPHPTEANARGANGSNGSSLTFDGDGEFGSKLLIPRSVEIGLTLFERRPF